MSRQIELRLRARGHGGWRAGAGRKPGPNPRIQHRSRAFASERHPRHVTLKVREDVPSLRSVCVVREIEESFRAGCRRDDFRLVHYSIQRDHLHVIVEASSAAALGRGMKSLGARLARVVNRTRSRRGPVLRDRYHVRVLRTPREVRNAIAYVLLNARKHAARGNRPLPRARVDPASSGRWFDGWRGRAPQALDLPAVAPARTWLLRAGWRRAGRVGLTEVPGCEP